MTESPCIDDLPIWPGRKPRPGYEFRNHGAAIVLRHIESGRFIAMTEDAARRASAAAYGFLARSLKESRNA